MAMHSLQLVDDAPAVDLFASAIPPIAAGTAVYIQNIGNYDVLLSDVNDMTAPLIITERGSATSIVSLDAGDAGFVSCIEGRAILTIVSEESA